MKDARLDVFLTKQHPQYSRSRIKKLIEDGFVRVDGEKRKPGFVLKGGERIEMVRRAPEIPKAKPEDLPLDILYEDRDLLILNKAAGMVVHPAPGHYEGTLVSAVLYHLQISPVGRELRPGIVHRLDKGTSGVMVVAKTEESLTALMRQFKDRVVSKHYRALVFGAFRGLSGTIRSAIGRDAVHRRKFSSKTRHAREAVTHYEATELFAGASRGISLLTLKPETGRTHQIRVHLSEAGHPIVGDAAYGAKSYLSSVKNETIRETLHLAERPLLHAWRLSFRHPVSGKAVCFEAPLPEDFENILRTLREAS